jgi:1-acyl-sn-glycerol-3-phosphate acyltransferase
MSITAGALAIVARMVSGVSVRWLDCAPDTCQRVYFANHTSHIDALIIWSSLPTEIRSLTRPVAAQDYWARTPLRRYLSSQFNAILIDRRAVKVHNNPVDMMIREIGDTHSLIVFPEGGRNPDSEMQEFKSGLYYLAKKRPDLELVPVCIENSHRVLPRGEFLPVPLLSRVTFGPPIFLLNQERKAAFLHRAREAIKQLKDR